MTSSTRDLLDAFDRLPDPERHELAVEILRRASQDGLPDPSDEKSLDAAYRLMASDQDREAEATEWVNATSGDVDDETR